MLAAENDQYINMIRTLAGPSCKPSDVDRARLMHYRLGNMLDDIQRKREMLFEWMCFYDSREAAESPAYGAMKIFEIEDGETHWVAAESETDAMRFHYRICGYDSLEEYSADMGGFSVRRLEPGMALRVDSDDGAEIKSCVDWADVEEACLIASTVY